MKPICDFCSERDVQWRLMAISGGVDIAYVHLESVGDWAACDTCMSLINIRDKKGLEDRAWKYLEDEIDKVMRMTDEEKVYLKERLREIQGIFWETWTGLVEKQ